MKKLMQVVPWLILGLLIAGAALAADDPGKGVFLAQKCNLCHSVQSASIDRTVKTSKAPDLSGVGAERTPEWIEKFLKKEEVINGKKHQKTVTASPEELAHLVKWLSGLKEAKKG
jgi:cytochrome c2